jgi:hypothetical protein
MKHLLNLSVCAGFFLFLAARAEKVQNGNDVARWFTEGDAAKKEEIRKGSEGQIHAFRFLEITEIRSVEGGGKGKVLVTKEPGSDMKVTLQVGTSMSLKLADTLVVGDAVAAQGRIESLGKTAPDQMVVNPAQLRYKDRLAPKAGKELLKEVDPRAN